MIKRITKLTGLLMISASIISCVPTMADDTKRIESKEGTVYSALAYYTDSGVFYIDADLNDNDEAVYMLKNGQYTKLENIEPGDDITNIVDDKYLEMNYGDADENYYEGYYVDINTGEKFYDIDKLNNHDKGLTLKSKIRKDNDGRFKKSNYTDNTIEPGVEFDGCTWNEYIYELEEPKVFGDYVKQDSLVYADKEGNYFDGDYSLGNLGVVTTGCSVTISDKEVILKNTSIKIKNTEDTYKIEDVYGNKYEIKALLTNADDRSMLGDCLYRTVYLSIWIKERGTDDSSYTNITDKVEFGSKYRHHKAPIINNGDYGSCTKVTQRMSMEVSESDIDGIKYSKNSNVYLTTDEDGKDETPDMFMFYNNGFTWEPDFERKELKARTVNCKTKEGYNYLDLGDIDYADVDITDFEDIWNTVSIGSAGLCCIHNGNVKKFNPSENKFVTLYQVDRDMNRINVAWEYTIVVWNEENGYYTIIDEPVPAWMMGGSEQGGLDESTPIEENEIKEDSILAISGWTKTNNEVWNYIKNDGSKAVGWIYDNNNWYYLDKEGIMQTGWIKDDNKWYYCNESGAMLADTAVDGYELGTDGAWII